jgi:hypothetical protein
LLLATPVAQAAIIASEDFDGGAVGLLSFSQSLDDTILGAGDMFGVRDRSTIVNGNGLPFAISDDSVVAAAGNSVFPPDEQGIVGQNKADKFFGVVDLTNDDNPSGMASAVWNFDISGATGLSLSIDVGAMGDFESSDAYRFSYSIDGEASMPLFDFVVNEAINQTYRAMDSGATHTLWVEYDGASERLVVYLSQTPGVKPASPVLSVTVDLPALLGPAAYVGFSAGTGGRANNHDIENWSLLIP